MTDALLLGSYRDLSTLLLGRWLRGWIVHVLLYSVSYGPLGPYLDFRQLFIYILQLLTAVLVLASTHHHPTDSCILFVVLAPIIIYYSSEGGGPPADRP